MNILNISHASKMYLHLYLWLCICIWLCILRVSASVSECWFDFDAKHPTPCPYLYCINGPLVQLSDSWVVAHFMTSKFFIGIFHAHIYALFIYTHIHIHIYICIHTHICISVIMDKQLFLATAILYNMYVYWYVNYILNYVCVFAFLFDIRCLWTHLFGCPDTR